MAGVQDVKDIEADLKRMLNMMSSGGRARAETDHQSSEGSLPGPSLDIMPQKTDQQGLKTQNDEKSRGEDIRNVGNEDKESNNSALDNRSEEKMIKRKKKRKKPKKKMKDKIAGVNGDNDSESGSEEEGKQGKKGQQPSNYGFQPKYLDDKLTPAVVKELEAQRIYPLKKRSAPFPNALYFCRLCDYHCDNIPVCRQHANDARHRRRLEIMHQDKKLKSLPTPSVDHYAALTTILEKVCLEHGLSDEDIKHREKIAQSLQDYLQKTMPDLKLRIYGSSLTRFGLKQSDLNLDLVLPAGTNPAKGLSLVYKTLLQSDVYTRVTSNFLAKVPSVLFMSSCGTVKCEITIGSDSAFFTSRYLALYSNRDSRLRKLAVLFRYWAKVCELDNQEHGTLPSYCYMMMTVYFLQQHQSQVLPVLWKDISEDVLKRPKTHQDIYDMFEELQKQPFTSLNDDSLGMLWIDLLQFYSVRFDMAEIVVCIRSQKLLHRHEKKWKSRRVAIEDPFSPKRNVARSMHSTRVFDYFYNCLRKACLYFSVPTTQNRSLSRQDKPLRKSTVKNCNKKVEIDSIERKEKEIEKEIDNCKENSGTNDHDKKDVVIKVLTADQTHESCSSLNAIAGNSEHNKPDITESPVVNYDTEIVVPGGRCERDSESSALTGTESDASIKPHILMENAGESVTLISDLEESVESDRVGTETNNFYTGKAVSKDEVKCADLTINSVCLNTKEILSNSGAGLHGAICDTSEKRNERVEVMNDENKEHDIDVTEINDNTVLQVEPCTDNVLTAQSVESAIITQGDIPVDLPSALLNITENLTEEGGCVHKISDLTLHDSETTSLIESTQMDRDMLELSDIVNRTLNDSESLFLTESSYIPYDSTQIDTDNVNSSVSTDVTQNDSMLDTTNNPNESINVTQDDSMLDTTDNPDEAMNITQNDSVTEDKVLESDTDSGSTSVSDLERESPGSSPVVRRQPSPGDKENQYNFVFTTHTLTDGKGPSIFCQICEREGHHKNNCPEDRLPYIKDLPPLTKDHIGFLSYVVEKVPNDFSLSKEELKEREYIRKNIEMYLLDDFPECELRLFGSSKNGFGFHQSDLDICVTFKDRSQKDVDFIECIEAIAKRLKTHRGLYNVFPITTAKVPIVKFKHRNSQLEGDISMYNVLALQNTKLLYTYACIDKRAKILGFAVKVFAKVCDIGDASKGSLSSYAYMLLMFHYLQHTKPPVIPVLQELRADDTVNTELMIDGWNAWFYEDLKTIPQIWPHYGRNKQSVGELWLGFFRYYMEEFNIVEQVATIRQFEPLTKFEKLWNGKCIAIEDPFDLNHNLGSGLSRKMNQYILRTFIHARELYGKPIASVPNGFDTLEDYFFDREQLTEGRPPSDRLCRVCSKIGHIAKECPRLIAKKEREAAEKKRREEMKKAQEKNLQNSPKQHERPPAASRSKSDPADYGSPKKRVNTQVYHRQHSESNQRQTSSGRDGYDYYQTTSPQSPQGHPFQNRYQQSPRASTPQGHHHQQQYQYRTQRSDRKVNMNDRSGPLPDVANYRKSAVELLAASKAEYVKSSKVLNQKQELKHPEILSVGNSEIIPLSLSPIRHSVFDDIATQFKDNSHRKHSDDRGNEIRKQTDDWGQNSPFHDKNNSIKHGPTPDLDQNDNITIPLNASQLSSCSNHQYHRKRSSSNSPEDKEFKRSTTPPEVPPRPVIHPKPSSALKSLSPPSTRCKPVTPPKPAPRAPTLTPGKPIPPPRPSRKPQVSIDTVDSGPNMESNTELISENGLMSNDQDTKSKRFSSVSAGAVMSVAREDSDRDINHQTSSASSEKSRNTKQYDPISKKLTANSLSTSVGVLVERQRSPLPKPRMGKQLEEPELPPRRPLHRSHSDLSSCRHSRTSSDFSDLSSRISRTSTEVERFFNEMGIDRTVLEPMRKLAETKNKDLLDNLSSLDSLSGRSLSSRLSNNDLDKAPMESEQDLMDRSTASGTTSVVERNARIIKWLCNVKKARSDRKPVEKEQKKS